MKNLKIMTTLGIFFLANTANAALIGWTTFDAGGGGVADTTPDVNTTANSVHGNSYSKTLNNGTVVYNNAWLTGNIGYWASSSGNKAGGTPSDAVLNDSTFGSDYAISDYMTGNYDATGSKQMKFYNGKLKADFSFSNHSDYVFRVEKIHYDVHVATSSDFDDLELVYLSGGPRSGADYNKTGEWINKSLTPDAEFNNLKLVRAEENIPKNVTLNRTVCLSCQDGAPGQNGGFQIGGVNTKSYVNPNKGAAFRFVLSTDESTTAGPTYIDNLAIEGSFFTDNTFSTEVFPDIAPVPLPGAIWLFLSGVAGLVVRKKAFA